MLSDGFLSAVRAIDYTSPVTKINVAVDRIPQFSSIPNSPDRDSVMPHHRCTIHLNCESMDLLEEAYRDAKDRGMKREYFSKKKIWEIESVFQGRSPASP